MNLSYCDWYLLLLKIDDKFTPCRRDFKSINRFSVLAMVVAVVVGEES